MKIYKDSSRTEVAVEITEGEILPFLDWGHVEYDRKISYYSILIKPDGVNKLADLFAGTAIDFETESKVVCFDDMELCINTDSMKHTIYIINGDEDSIWINVSLGREEFLTIIDRAYELWKAGYKHECIVS